MKTPATDTPATDRPEHRDKAYNVLASLTKAERDDLRARLFGPEQGEPTTTIGAHVIDTRAAQTVLAGNSHERFLALFPNHWGVGPYPRAAIAKAREHGARGKDYYVMRMPVGTYGARVDSPLGDWSYFWALDVERDEAPVCVAASGRARNMLSASGKGGAA